jgi:predicted negative regulator of RcsB-dependent stress response
LAAKRLTRKEIVRQDRIQQTLTETSSFLLRNLKYIITAAAMVLVALAATYLWRTYQQSVEAELQARFSDALAKYHASITQLEDEELPDPSAAESPQPPATKYEFATLDERSENSLVAFRQLSDEYPDKRLGMLARYYVGLTLIDLERFDEARDALNSVIDESDSADICNLARNALAQLAVGEGNQEEAIRLLNEILEEPSRNFPEQIVLMRLAENYEAVGDYQSALRNYKRISAEFAGSTFAQRSDARIDYFELRGITIEEDDTEEEDPSSEVQD